MIEFTPQVILIIALGTAVCVLGHFHNRQLRRTKELIEIVLIKDRNREVITREIDKRLLGADADIEAVRIQVGRILIDGFKVPPLEDASRLLNQADVILLAYQSDRLVVEELRDGTLQYDIVDPGSDWRSS